MRPKISLNKNVIPKEDMKMDKPVAETPAVTRNAADRTAPEGVRRRSVAFGVPTAKLGVNREIPGYHLHWLNDTPGRIGQAIDGGYEFVTKNEIELNDGVTPANSDLGDKVRRLVGKEDNGEPAFAYLMKIKNEWHEEAQGQIQSQVDRVDGAIRSGQITAPGQDTSGTYAAGIKY